MAKIIGRLFNVGIAKESSRGTAVAPTYWMPKMSLSIDDKVTQVLDDSSVGVIEDSENMEVCEKWSEGEISGRIDNTKLGLLITALLGSDSAAQVGGDTSVYDHTITVLKSAQHPSLTISLSEPNASGASSRQYTLAMITEMGIEMQLKKYAIYKAKFRANASASGNVTPSFSTTENAFLPQMITVAFDNAYSGLGAASTIAVKSVKVNFKKNVEDDFILGSVVAADRLNKQFEVDGEIEMMYSARTYIDTNLMGDVYQAMRIKMLGTTGIGTSSFPTITLDFAKCKFSEIARKIDNNGLVTQTLKFKAHYSLSDSLMLQCVVRNLITTAY